VWVWGGQLRKRGKVSLSFLFCNRLGVRTINLKSDCCEFNCLCVHDLCVSGRCLCFLYIHDSDSLLKNDLNKVLNDHIYDGSYS
jgi:hypothetical protein